MNYPVNYQVGQPYRYPAESHDDQRQFPVLPFLSGLAFAPFFYGAIHPGGYYYPYPPYPPYYPYGYGYPREGYY